MLTWFKKLLGVAPVETKQEPLVLEDPVVVETKAPVAAKATTAKPKTTTKKSSTTKAPAKKAETKKEEVLVDTPKDRKAKLKNGTFAAMKKTELLSYTKANGIAANSSMKKEDIIQSIKDA